jgi:citrate synthase
MSEFSPGLAGVVAVETEIAEPDREGGELRYRGVNIEDLVGHVHFEKVWGLLVDESLEPGLPAAYCELELRTGGHMSDLQAALASLSGKWKLGQLIDIDDDQAKEDLRRLSAAALSIVAQSARGADKPPVPQEKVLEGETAAERFLLAWRGEVNEAHAKAIDTYWICTAEHGLNASTFTARIVASTGADCGAALSSAVGALSGPLHGGAPARVLPMLDAVAEMGDAEKWVAEALARKDRIMGFGHRIYRAEDPRSRLLKKAAKELGSPRVEVAEALEQAAHEAIAKKHPDHSYTNVEFWSAIVLDVAEIPPNLAPAMFACSRTAGWSAHILEQKQLGVLVRPSAKYVGPGARSLQEV